jgi:hypothetical protein
MTKGKHPGGRPKGSKTKGRTPAQPNLHPKKVQPCPNLRDKNHGADCTICGGTGEYTPK